MGHFLAKVAVAVDAKTTGHHDVPAEEASLLLQVAPYSWRRARSALRHEGRFGGPSPSCDNTLTTPPIAGEPYSDRPAPRSTLPRCEAGRTRREFMERKFLAIVLTLAIQRARLRMRRSQGPHLRRGILRTRQASRANLRRAPSPASSNLADPRHRDAHRSAAG